MEQITLCGKTLKEIREEKSKMVQAASSEISKRHSEVTSRFKLIQAIDDTDELKRLLKESYELLKSIDDINTATGVEYYFEDGELTYTLNELYDFEDIADEFSKGKIHHDLLSLAEEMEWCSERWNQSNC